MLELDYLTEKAGGGETSGEKRLKERREPKGREGGKEKIKSGYIYTKECYVFVTKETALDTLT